MPLWRIESKTSGKGYTFESSFAEAAHSAQLECTTDASCWVVWSLPSNIRVAEVTLRGVRWMKTSLSAVEIKTLMRRHKWKIASLSFRLGLPEERIRKARQRGLSDPYAVRDWVEAITGEDIGPLPNRYHIRHHVEEASCATCGYPMDVGDLAFEYLNEVFCSIRCARQSRGWGRELVT